MVDSATTIACNLISGLERLSGGYANHYFFAEGTAVRIDSLGGDERFWNTTEGGALTTSLCGTYRMMQDIIDKSGISGDSPRQEIDSVMNLTAEATLGFIETDTTLTGLLWIYDKIISDSHDRERALELFRDRYVPRFGEHPYTAEIMQQLSGATAEPGKRYPDFSAPEATGEMHTLSELIDGKFAVIDLWASWCVPCRRHSKELIPVYERWKDKGFTIVGVARERGNADAMEKAVVKDGYPWINLVEINDEGKIWHKYRAGAAGGRIVFVSPDGKIIAIDPKASEIDAILGALLNDR